MGKKTVHRGMSASEEENEEWRKDHHEMSTEQHQTFMKKMGISEEEDKTWHEPHRSPEEVRTGRKSINPFAIGGGFLSYCVKRGWLRQEGKGRTAKYYSTELGKEELRNYGIEI